MCRSYSSTVIRFPEAFFEPQVPNDITSLIQTIGEIDDQESEYFYTRSCLLNNFPTLTVTKVDTVSKPVHRDASASRMMREIVRCATDVSAPIANMASHLIRNEVSDIVVHCRRHVSGLTFAASKRKIDIYRPMSALRFDESQCVEVVTQLLCEVVYANSTGRFVDDFHELFVAGGGAALPSFPTEIAEAAFLLRVVLLNCQDKRSVYDKGHNKPGGVQRAIRKYRLKWAEEFWKQYAAIVR